MSNIDDAMIVPPEDQAAWQDLRESIRSRLNSINANQTSVLSVAQLSAIAFALLWHIGAINMDGTIKPPQQWM